MEFDALSGKVISAALKVHRELGPGFLESIYHAALLVQLRHDGLNCNNEKEVHVSYAGVDVGVHRLDLVVNDQISWSSKLRGNSTIATWRKSFPISRPRASRQDCC